MAFISELETLMPDAKQEAKVYLASREIPQLFESVTIALLHHKPDKPVEFVQDCINLIRDKKGFHIRWNTFIETPPPSRAGFTPSISKSSEKKEEANTEESKEQKPTPDNSGSSVVAAT